ncbi:MAG: tryptophan--tRNA ligase [Eubacteriales bacterium]
MDEKKIIFSGVQPSGTPTLGNYIGAFKNWVKLQDEYNCYYCAVDMHAITIRQNAAEFRSACLDMLAIFLAMGLDPEKSILYMQSHVSAHAELAWVLNCYTYLGELNRMTQFKDKSAKNEENLNAGLYTYPVLMAADILLYGAHMVPIGADQKQHLELARDVATRFNNLYGDVFVVPEPYIGKVGARIMSLTEPEKKMSKSDDNPKAYISLLDDPNVIMKKFKSAVTDSMARIKFCEEQPGVSNLLSIYSAVTGTSIEEAEKTFEGKGYGDLKTTVGEAVVAEIEPFQAAYKRYRADKAYLNEVMKDGAEKASRNAQRILRKVKKKVGFVPQGM